MYHSPVVSRDHRLEREKEDNHCRPDRVAERADNWNVLSNWNKAHDLCK